MDEWFQAWTETPCEALGVTVTGSPSTMLPVFVLEGEYPNGRGHEGNPIIKFVWLLTTAEAGVYY